MADREENRENKGVSKTDQDSRQNKATDNRSREEKESQEQENELYDQYNFQIPHRDRIIKINKIKHEQDEIRTYLKGESGEEEKEKSKNKMATRLMKYVQLSKEQRKKYIIKDVEEIKLAADLLSGRKGGGDRSTNIKDLEREINSMINKIVQDFDTEEDETVHESQQDKLKEYLDEEGKNKESKKKDESDEKKSKEESEKEDNEEEEGEQEQEKEEKEEDEGEEIEEEESELEDEGEKDFEQEENNQEQEEEMIEPEAQEETQGECEKESMEETDAEEVENEEIVEHIKHAYEKSQKELEEKIEHMKNHRLSDHEDEGSDGFSHHK
ncbi:MAG: hypothetical protein VX737_03660 [Pseudomonadota bacterium]|nr:hypothetical protein [Pseudomonadota bacterium]